MKKTKILFVMPQLNTGGAERVMVHLINGIDREKFEIALILFNPNGTLLEEVSSDITIHHLNIGSVSRGLLACLRKIYKIKPDIVFSGIGHLNIALAVFIPIFRYLLPQTDWIARQSSILSINNQQEKYPPIHEWLYRRVYKNYDKIICQSLYMQDDLIDNYHFPIDKSVVIHNPVDIRAIESLSHEEMAFPYESNSINLLSVGQLRPEKRHDLLLKAFARLDDNYRLTLIGDGEKRDELEALALELGIEHQVRFLGYQKNPYLYMKQANAVVLSSAYEGFPNVVLEANACGKPVVSVRCAGGVAEIIEDKINGFLVLDNDIEQLAEGMRRVVEYPFDANRIKKIITQKYSKHLIIKQYEKNLKEDIDYE